AFPTAQAVLGDVLMLARERGRPAGNGAPLRTGRRSEREEALPRLSPDDVRTKYYLRLIVEDRPGVLAQVANRLGGAGVSVAQMFQEPGVRGEASITMLTHEARDKDVRDAVQAIASLPAIRKKPRAVRIFDI